MSEPASANSAIQPDAIDAMTLRTMMAAAAYQARRVARTLKLSPAEREDVEQEILLVLLERRRFFDPARGPWTPFAHRIARQAAQSVADALVAARKISAVSLDQPWDAALDRELGRLADAIADDAVPGEPDILYNMSFMGFLATLPPDLRCAADAALAADGDLADAQRALGLSTSEFYRRLREVRYRLFSIGLARFPQTFCS
jgi:DNA-directed RNA polymerase specialized sigma24 family protein